MTTKSERQLDRECAEIDRGVEAYLFSDDVIAPHYHQFNAHLMRYSRQGRLFHSRRV